MKKYHRNNGGYYRKSNNRYSHSRNRGRGYNAKKNIISIDKLIAKAVDNTPVNMFVDDYEYSQFKITKVLKKNAYDHGYSNPTKIQYKAIPEILKGKDILGVASTGSGKTAAFLIPLIDKVVRDNNNRVLIIVPTRELAMQIQDEFKIFSKNTNVKSVLIMGGNSIKTQINILRSNPQFIIATPGRLKDLTNRGLIDLNTINNIVLDEVDRMLDMGFIHDIKFVISKLSKNRQSLFFSATLNRNSEEIANSFLSNPVKIEIETQGPGKNVDQDVVRLEKGQNKFDVLLELLKKDSLDKVLIFTSTKWGADKLCKSLKLKDVYIESLHGGKRQNKRSRIIERFKNGKTDVLVATDVASRGLDIDDISHVINYDMPQCYDDYTHRIGRTGRAGKKGFALTFV